LSAGDSITILAHRRPWRRSGRCPLQPGESVADRDSSDGCAGNARRHPGGRRDPSWSCLSCNCMQQRQTGGLRRADAGGW